MKSLLKLAIASVLAIGLLSAEALAQVDPVPHKINVQGVLRNVAGEVVSGTYDVVFTLYEDSAGMNVVFQQPKTLTVTGGVFSTQLGEFPSSVFVDKPAMYLGIQVGADPELPLVELTSTGFAIQAEHAEQADILLGAAPDLDCVGCVDETEVSFDFAAGVTKNGPAADLQCVGCVSGGADGDIADSTITTDNIGSGEVRAGNIGSAQVGNIHMAPDAIYSSNIKDGEVREVDLADGAVTSDKIAEGAVGDLQLGINYAASDRQAGPALDVTCSETPCIDQDEVTFIFAKGVDQNGDAAGLDCLAEPCVESGEVTFNYAGSTTKGGAASDLACVDCVSDDEVEFPWAMGDDEGGAAVDVNCTNCIQSGEVAFNYAGAATKGGPASDVDCAVDGCIDAGEAGFAWAAGDQALGGGAAVGLNCTGCVDGTDVANGAITDNKITGPITGSKITAATTTALGVVKIGGGLSVSGGLLTPTWGTAAGTVSEGDHTHSEYFRNSLDDLYIGDGKILAFLDPGDYPGDHYGYFSEASPSSDNKAVIRLTLGSEANASEYFEIYADASTNGGQKHRFDAGGAAYHSGALTLGGDLLCNGCVKTGAIATGGVESVDILDHTITADDLAENLSLNTTGTVTAAAGYMSIYYDKDNNSFYADPHQSSRMNTIRYDSLEWAGDQRYGFHGANAYANVLSTGVDGDTLQIQHDANHCANVDMFAGGCASEGRTFYVRGSMQTQRMYDLDNTGFYVDPASTTKLRYLTTANDTRLPNSDGVNHIRGTTYSFADTWYDHDSSTYYLDPSSNSRFNLVYSNGMRFYNSWPGNASGFSQVANSGGNLMLSPDSAASDQVVMRYGSANRIVFRLNGATSTSQPSFRTNGNYLVMNPGTNDKRILMLWDTGGKVEVNGTVHADSWIDNGGSGCVSDPNGTSLVDHLKTDHLYAREARVYGLRVDNGSLWVRGNGGQSSGIRMYHWATIAPHYNARSTVGMSSRRFWGMYAYNYLGSSNRELKRDIQYYDRDQIDAVGDVLHGLKPASYFYKEEVGVDSVEEGDENARIRKHPHVGLMLDEMPDVISDGGTAWSLNDSVGFLLVAGKYLEDKNREQTRQIQALEDRLATLEQIVVDAGLYN